MIPFYSKRNQVYPTLWHGRGAVEKHFTDLGDWRRETERYALLADYLPLPPVLFQEPGLLITGYCPQPTLLEVLERQESTGFSPTPWQALAAWLCRCYTLSGQLPGEGNLRNFLWDEKSLQVIGLDLEGYSQYPLEQCGGVMIAALLEYAPTGTPVKGQAAALLERLLGTSPEDIRLEREKLRTCRSRRQRTAVSGIILAGGASRRMGTDKAGLTLHGKPLLVRQVEKMRQMGITDIMLSGGAAIPMPGTRTIPDIYPGRGPLGGIHACLAASEHPRCLVLSVDTPLVPASILARLCQTHTGGITVLRCGEKQEPLVGVYDRALAPTMSDLIAEGGKPVRALSGCVKWNMLDYLGPEVFLKNCNTPADFTEVEEIFTLFARQSIVL